MKLIFFITLAIIFLGTLTQSAELPKKYLSGYSSFFLGGSIDSIEQELFIPMNKANFNSVELKIQQSICRRMNIKEHENEIAELVKRANRNGLIFQIYAFPEPYNGRRKTEWPEHAKLPALVDFEGMTVKDAFALTSFSVWRETFSHVWDFAELSKKYPIAAVKFDIETISNTGLSYDDYTWKLFCRNNPKFRPGIAATERYKTLQDANALELYKAFFILEFGKVVQQIEKELHAINPKLMLGYMPAHHGWMADTFSKYLATSQAPAIVDDWSMYNGEGFDEKVLARQKHAKELNPYNLYIPWFRGNSYESEDMSSLAYHAAASCDGYSIWTMLMFNEKKNKVFGYNLPGKRTGDMYLNAYKDANNAILLDLQNNTIANPKRIILKKIKALVPPLDYSKMEIPDLVPAGNGTIQGSTPSFVLRDQQNILIYAKAGEAIKITLSHLAGDARPLALHYALIDKKHQILRKESVSPAASDTFSVQVPETGIYALVVTGGLGGQAWYGVKVFNSYFAVDARTPAYFFEPQQIYVAGSNYGNHHILVNTTETEAYIYSINEGGKNAIARQVKNLVNLSTGISKITFLASKVAWGQNFYLSLPNGKVPYIFSSPERLLLPVGINLK